jgi:hypothetical protein
MLIGDAVTEHCSGKFKKAYSRNLEETNRENKNP